MEIVNRVVQSGIVVYDLEDLWDEGEVKTLDIAPFLDQGLIVRERLFRKRVADFDWDIFNDAHVAMQCSTNALVPAWAYMLVVSRLSKARSVGLGTTQDIMRDWFMLALEREDWSRFEDRIVVVKGCGTGIVPESAYVRVMNNMMSVARKVMYGEPCSNVPLWRMARKNAN